MLQNGQTLFRLWLFWNAKLRAENGMSPNAMIDVTMTYAVAVSMPFTFFPFAGHLADAPESTLIRPFTSIEDPIIFECTGYIRNCPAEKHAPS
jgi:hypothetical protein